MPYRLPTRPDETPTGVFNPHGTRDFSFVFAHDSGKKTYTLPAMRVTVLPRYVALNLADRLADQLVQIRGIRLNYQADKADTLKEILVKYDI